MSYRRNRIQNISLCYILCKLFFRFHRFKTACAPSMPILCQLYVLMHRAVLFSAKKKIAGHSRNTQRVSLPLLPPGSDGVHDSLLRGTRLSHLGHLLRCNLAERVGFELTVLAYTRVPGVHLKPLGHLSLYLKSNRSEKKEALNSDRHLLYKLCFGTSFKPSLLF